TFVDAVLDGRPARQEIPWVEADADGDLELPAGLHRLVVHVTQVPGDDAARAPIRAQDEDAMEREVPRALPLGDPDARGDVPARVLREELGIGSSLKSTSVVSRRMKSARATTRAS